MSGEGLGRIRPAQPSGRPRGQPGGERTPDPEPFDPGEAERLASLLHRAARGPPCGKGFRIACASSRPT